nr:hypothetical protein MACL_00003394 [Theileria orientalis]
MASQNNHKLHNFIFKNVNTNMGKAAGNLVMSKIRVKNTFMNLPEDQECTGTAIYKSLSMPTLEDNFNQWYIYNLPCFEDREHCKQLMFNSENDNSGVHSMLKPASMFKYNQERAHSDATHSNECIPLDDNGKLTSIGSVRHLIGDCKPCAFNRHHTKTCMNGIRCNFCHFDHTAKRKTRFRIPRNH